MKFFWLKINCIKKFIIYSFDSLYVNKKYVHLRKFSNKL